MFSPHSIPNCSCFSLHDPHWFILADLVLSPNSYDPLFGSLSLLPTHPLITLSSVLGLYKEPHKIRSIPKSVRNTSVSRLGPLQAKQPAISTCWFFTLRTLIYCKFFQCYLWGHLFDTLAVTDSSAFYLKFWRQILAWLKLRERCTQY